MTNNSRVKNSLKNISNSLMSQIISLIANFVVRTIFIKYLGEEYLGVNGLFTNILSILSLAELGFGSAMIYNMYKPLAEITKENKSALQFLDLMTTIDKYSELSGDLLKEKLQAFVKAINVDFEIVKKYISLFPDKVYRNIYQGGLMIELV